MLHQGRWYAGILWLLAASMCIGAMTTPRFFAENYVESLGAQNAGLLPAALARLSTLAILLVLALGLLVMTAGLRLRRAGSGLWIASLLWLLGPTLAMVFGSRPGVEISVLALPVVFTLFYLARPVPLETFVKQAQGVLLAIAAASALAAAILPKWALESNYDEAVVGNLPRLHGIAPHANILAPLMATYLILGWVRPGRGRAASALVILILLFTQSKTTIIALLLAYGLRTLLTITKEHSLNSYLVQALAVTALVVGPVYLMLSPTWYETLTSSTPNSASAVTTLVSREDAWRVTIDVWRENVMIGYGPHLWDQSMRLEYKDEIGWAAPHAHNQLLQSLGEGGVVGAIGMLTFVVALCIAAWRLRLPTRHAALGLVVLLLMRTLTEVPLRTSLTDGNVMLVLILLGLLLAASRRSEDRPARRVHVEPPRALRLEPSVS